MALTPGSRIGSYEIAAQIGVGGMGEVYRATDTNLGRQVAVKVLPDPVASDAERLARFDREAKTLAALNHPNIAQIYGLERSEGHTALVMELVEGPTLADRIAHGPIPVDEALGMARQIAEALEAAHEQGIIHRDLKPANVKVRPDGTVKVLDFGLAKAMEPTEAMSSTLSMSPTITTPAMTQAGMILGTAAYMSPEQARGKPVDRRADIWAFGCVLYEMLAGVPAFAGEDVGDTLGNVMKVEPDWSRLPASMPDRVDRVVRACLQKKPRQRLDSAQDVRLALEGAFETTAVAPLDTDVDPQVPLWRRAVPYAVTAVVVAFAVGLAAWVLTRPAAPRVARLHVPTSPPPAVQGGAVPELAISPDGTRIVYGAGDHLYVRDLGQLDAVPLRGGEGRWPFFSPDGNSVGFWRPPQGGPAPQLVKVSILGGPPFTIGESIGFDGATWGAEDTIIFAMRNNPTGLFRVPAGGGDPEPLTTLEDGETAHRWPHLLPGDEALLFTVVRAEGIENMEIAALDLATRERHLLVPGGSNPHYASTGHIVYGVDGTLRAVPFDAETLTVTGDPVPVLEGVRTHASGAVQFGFAADGSLVYLPGGAGTDEGVSLVWLDRQGNESPFEVGETRRFSQPRLSPDGTRLAVSVAQDDEGGDVWVSELALGTLRRLTTDPAQDGSPLWTPDGEQVVFASQREGSLGLYALPWGGGGEPERLMVLDEANVLEPTSWAPDGTLVFTYRTPESGGLNVGVLSPDADGVWEPLLESNANEAQAMVSPNGEWVTYVSDRGGVLEVYVQRFPGLGGEQLISRGFGVAPAWSQDGEELFFFSAEEQGLVARSVEVGVNSLRVTTEETLVTQSGVNSVYRFGRGRREYDLSPDGQRVLVARVTEAGNTEAEGPPAIVLIQNWFEELKRLVPTD